MGKGSKRREFDKDREESFVKHHQEIYGTRKKSDTPRKLYVVQDGNLVLMEAR